jgi:23S rRNA (adenine2503-C2)-methyltransferase
MQKINLKSLTKSELDDFIASLGEKPFRAGQIWSWLYNKGAVSFDDMSNLSKGFRDALAASAEIPRLALIRKTSSEAHGTQKFLWRLEDGFQIESVAIPESDRKTVCISSQVGCALGCTFCATGRMGFTRNLHAHEIVDQVLSVRRETSTQPTNVVVMGMGEPFLNYENVIQALGVLNDPGALSIGHRRITISTSGIVPRIRQFADENRPYKLAVSLNAARNDLRGELMPVNRTYPMNEVIGAVRYYTGKTKRRATFEYVLLKGVNDSDAEAGRLLRLLKGLPCKVNLIAFNPTGKNHERPDAGRIHAFAERIKSLQAPVNLRLSRGDDIAAACGQLAGDTRPGVPSGGKGHRS